MDSIVLPTILGSVASGLTSVVLSFFGRHALNRKRMHTKDLANRELLYSEFIKEVGELYISSLDGTLKSLHR